MHDGRFRGLVARADRPRVQVHGEIHNLASVAQAAGLSTASPPTEVLSAQWSRLGSAMLCELDGVFALSVVDPEGVHLYRDASGLRDVFWAEPIGSPSAFASWTHGLFESCPPRLAASGLHEYLRLLDVAAPATVFQGIRAVEPGQLVTLAPGKPARATTPQTRKEAHLPRTLDDATDTLNERLRDAIAVRLRGSARPAAFLSAGIDSTLICAIAARQRPDLVALTVSFDGDGDESLAAAAVAKQLGLRHEVLRFGWQEWLRAVERLASTSDQPLADPATPATLLALEAASTKFDVLLDGTGADEAAGFMPPRHVRVADEWSTLLPAPVRHALTRSLVGRRTLGRYTPLFDFDHPVENHLRWRGFSRRQIAELCGTTPDAVDLQQTRLYGTYEGFARRAHFERGSALNDVMPCERLTQAMLSTGMTMRFPFTAPAVDQFLRQLRTEWRWQPGQPKFILRHLLARYLPRELWDRPKQGFGFPLVRFLSEGDGRLVRQHVVNPVWAPRAGLDPAAVAAWGRRFLDGDSASVFKAWALVILGAWLEAHTHI